MTRSTTAAGRLNGYLRRADATAATAPGEDPVVHVEDVTVEYNGVRALDGVTAVIGTASVTGLIGPNGAGKTTLLNVLTGFIRPTCGSVHVGGVDVTHHTPHRLARRGIVRTWQGSRLFPTLTVLENVLVGGHFAGKRVDSAMRWLEELHLLHALHATVGTLSLGERRRLAFARSLASEPTFLLLDEPVAGLEAHEKREIAEIIRRISASVRVVLVEHDVPTVASVAEEIVVLQAGRVLAAGERDAMLRDPAVREAYLGDIQIEFEPRGGEA